MKGTPQGRVAAERERERTIEREDHEKKEAADREELLKQIADTHLGQQQQEGRAADRGGAVDAATKNARAEWENTPQDRLGFPPRKLSDIMPARMPHSPTLSQSSAAAASANQKAGSQAASPAGFGSQLSYARSLSSSSPSLSSSAPGVRSSPMSSAFASMSLGTKENRAGMGEGEQRKPGEKAQEREEEERRRDESGGEEETQREQPTQEGREEEEEGVKRVIIRAVEEEEEDETEEGAQEEERDEERGEEEQEKGAKADKQEPKEDEAERGVKEEDKGAKKEGEEKQPAEAAASEQSEVGIAIVQHTYSNSMTHI